MRAPLQIAKSKPVNRLRCNTGFTIFTGLPPSFTSNARMLHTWLYAISRRLHTRLYAISRRLHTRLYAISRRLHTRLYAISRRLNCEEWDMFVDLWFIFCFLWYDFVRFTGFFSLILRLTVHFLLYVHCTTCNCKLMMHCSHMIVH